MPTQPHRISQFVPVNIVALDQELHRLHAVTNGAATVDFDPKRDIKTLPAGGGYVIADANVWTVRNPLSQSQYCWETATALTAFLDALAERGYRAIVVANKLANSLWRNGGHTQADAVRALYAYAHQQVSDHKGRTAPQAMELPCGCDYHWTFDSGRPVRSGAAPVDRSYGERARVTDAFLRLQNDGGYNSPFAEDVVRAAWEALDKEGRKLFNLKQRTPATDSPNRLMAVAVCTHDPATGMVRTHGDEPWGTGFICDRLIGLNGAMRGTGTGAPGNPMRAVLRILGRRHGVKVSRTERAALDRHVRNLVPVLQQHPMFRAATSDAI